MAATTPQGNHFKLPPSYLILPQNDIIVSVNALKTKLRQLKYNLKHGLSVENVVLVIAIIMCLTWTYQSVKAMSRNWELTERLNADKKSLELLKVEIETAELENEYYKSEEYQELAARRLLDKKLPGEAMISLPANSEAAKTKHQAAAIIKSEKRYSNFEKWMMFLFPNV